MRRRHTGFTIQPEILDWIDHKAARERRSRSRVVEIILLEYFEKNPENGLDRPAEK